MASGMDASECPGLDSVVVAADGMAAKVRDFIKALSQRK
jgi:hypothetical protein